MGAIRMNKIIVTEEQAKVIENYLLNRNTKISQFNAIEHATLLDFVTIARIVEGEGYEVKRDFKVGDIVRGKNGRTVLFIIEVNDVFILCTDKEVLIDDERWVTNYRHEDLTLICKVENREDLQ